MPEDVSTTVQYAVLVRKYMIGLFVSYATELIIICYQNYYREVTDQYLFLD